MGAIDLEHLDKRYEFFKGLAREELDEHEDPERYEYRVHDYAVRWTQDEVNNVVLGHFDQKWWEHQDNINKVFYQ